MNVPTQSRNGLWPRLVSVLPINLFHHIASTVVAGFPHGVHNPLPPERGIGMIHYPLASLLHNSSPDSAQTELH